MEKVDKIVACTDSFSTQQVEQQNFVQINYFLQIILGLPAILYIMEMCLGKFIFSRVKKNESYLVTDSSMTRFNITLKQSVDMVMWAVKNMQGGEIFVPKIPSYNIIDLVKAFNDKPKIKNIGIRPGEKLHEEMISISEAINTVDLGKYFAILNEFAKDTKKYRKAKFVNKNFYYNLEKKPKIFITK